MNYKGLEFDGNEDDGETYGMQCIRDFVDAVEKLLGRVPTQKELSDLALPFVTEEPEEGWTAAFNMSSQG